jgi:hypothetical protein
MNVGNLSLHQLVRQAGYTAEEWLGQAVKAIDKEFGEGFAEKNPALVGSFIQGAGLDQIAMYIKSLSESLYELPLQVTLENGMNNFSVDVDILDD